MFTTNYNGKNFCQVIDNFYSCCENCTDCGGTSKFCSEKIPSINYRKEYLKELKGVIGKNLFNILMTRIKKFDTLPPFSDESIREIQTRWDFPSIGFQCKQVTLFLFFLFGIILYKSFTFLLSNILSFISKDGRFLLFSSNIFYYYNRTQEN